MSLNQSLIADRLNLTDEQIVAELNAATIQQTDSQRWTWAGIADRFGFSFIAVVKPLIKSLGDSGELIDAMLTNPGIDFSRQDTQDTLESIRAVLGDTNTDTLKAIGVWHVSPWIHAGNETDVTVEQVAAIRLDYVTRRDAGAYLSRVINAGGLLVDAGRPPEEVMAAVRSIV